MTQSDLFRKRQVMCALQTTVNIELDPNSEARNGTSGEQRRKAGRSTGRLYLGPFPTLIRGVVLNSLVERRQKDPNEDTKYWPLPEPCL